MLRLPLHDADAIGVKPTADNPGHTDVAVAFDGMIHVFELPDHVWASIQERGYIDLVPEEEVNHG